MNAEIRRARILAVLLDLLLPAAAASVAGLFATLAVWLLWPSRSGAAGVVWAALAACTVAGFLLRDSAGGRARRWLGLELRGPGGKAPGVPGSIWRNFPLLIPGWNLVDAWPVLRDGASPRRCDRRGTRIVAED